MDPYPSQLQNSYYNQIDDPLAPPSKNTTIGQKKEHVEATDKKVSKFSLDYIKYFISLAQSILIDLCKKAFKIESFRDWYNPIKSSNTGEDFQIVLGALPLTYKGSVGGGSAEGMRNDGITHVLSLNERFELEPTIYSTPLNDEQYGEQGINRKHLSTPDFLPPDIETLRKGVTFLNDAIKEEGKVYVHCKAGVGRSASTVIAYLMVVKGRSFEEAYRIVKRSRSATAINNKQMEGIMAFATHCKDNNLFLGAQINDESPLNLERGQIWKRGWRVWKNSWRQEHDKDIIKGQEVYLEGGDMEI